MCRVAPQSKWGKRFDNFLGACNTGVVIEEPEAPEAWEWKVRVLVLGHAIVDSQSVPRYQRHREKLKAER